MGKRILQIGMLAALVAVALVLRNGQRLPEQPQDAVNAFFTAARDGDAEGYLRLTTGELRKSLEQLRRQQGAAAFRENMRRSLDGVKGQAVRKLPQAPVSAEAFEVELVFGDRNEVQTFILEPVGSGWAIASIETARVYRPEIPYGTPVFAEPK